MFVDDHDPFAETAGGDIVAHRHVDFCRQSLDFLAVSRCHARAEFNIFFHNGLPFWNYFFRPLGELGVSQRGTGSPLKLRRRRRVKRFRRNARSFKWVWASARKWGAGPRPAQSIWQGSGFAADQTNAMLAVVRADDESLVPPQAAGLALSVARPLPTETASLGFGGSPVGGGD